ncbi:3-keto-5-aminohexanoate cleavage protein [Micromonospora sp. NPDC023737]|uniref:3-keto-5-aminohexanoate cleavage protein n=1 Tax=unclassified Micromonospora TaxID=2617518 RepID=UPI003401197B
MGSRIRRIKACLNGGRRSDEHPAVPITADELASAAVDAVAAGAEALHLHPRDHVGAETLHLDHVAAAVTAVRRTCPGVPVGVSTGLWISDGDAGRRVAAVARWADLPVAARPDVASVNVSEAGFAELVETLQRAGVGVEAGVWSTADAQELAGFGAASWTRVLVEIVDGAAEAAVATADAILVRLDELGVAGQRLLHGEEAACWQLVAHAGRLGLPTRIGLEDTVVGPDGEPVVGNADLVQQALAVWTAASSSR